MKTRSKVSGKSNDGRRRKAFKPKRGPAQNEASRVPTSTVGKDEKIARLTRERAEARKEQAATSEVLQLISRATGDLTLVFAAILENAVRLCEATFGDIYSCETGALHLVASHNSPPALAEERRRSDRVPPHPDGPTARILATKAPVHIVDLAKVRAYKRTATSTAAVELGGVRTFLGVPMLKENELIGILFLNRRFVRPFTDKQIDLVKNFAAQAVIAIENARLFNELRGRTQELTEALEQRTATSEVLGLISSSSGELSSVFDAILANALRFCDADTGHVLRADAGALSVAAMRGGRPEYAQFLRERGPWRPAPNSAPSQAMEQKMPMQLADMRETSSFTAGGQVTVAAVELGGLRTVLMVPMIADEKAIGIIVIYRRVVRPFSDKQVGLVENFAKQAVIAIENARLLNELRQSLEEQTATSDVLGIISSSPGELEPVFAAILASATRICEAEFGNLFLYEEDAFRAVAWHGEPTYVNTWRGPALTIKTDVKDIPLARLTARKRPVHVADLRQEAAYKAGHKHLTALVDKGGARTLLIVPMVKERNLVGAIAIYRQEVRSFTDKQIALMENFASQAVIAIENARLLNELRRSLEQQTATSEVLRVISSSPGDLEPIFATMLEKAVSICDAKFGNIHGWDGKAIHLLATHNTPPAFAEWRRRHSPYPSRSRKTSLGLMLSSKVVVHVSDAAKQPGYSEERDPLSVAAVELGGARTVLYVPMLKEDELVGAFTLSRQEVRPFTEEQINLVKNFAAQAVVAIENARLLSELRQRTNDLTQRTSDLTEALEQQTATSEVLEVISRSAFDLQSVFETVAESSVRLCGADRAFIFRFDGELLRMVVGYNSTPGFVEWVAQNPIRPGRHSGSARAALERRTIHITDVLADPEYVYGAKDVEPIRTVLGVPILKGDDLLGVMMIYRLEVRPFTDRQIALVETFADQAAIAIENVRLFESVGARTRELAKSLDDLRTTQDRLVQTQKLASLGQLTAGIAHEIKNPLNFVNNFSGVSVELIDELHESLRRVQADDKTRGEISELADTLRDNLSKIVQHGRRADAIVKNMLLHSREGSGEHRSVDINAMVDEALNLAYHGARAEKPDFVITLQRSFDPEAGQAEVFPQDITRVLLNLIANGFYAAIKRKGTIDSQGYQPTVAAITRSLGDRVAIGIRDNGTGMPPEVKEKMFNPFFTTKPAGEGTGLGLSISYDIIVKQHAGSIEVDTQPGEFTEIRIILPRS
jgi:two-component system, NtrC family, sensor kinase